MGIATKVFTQAIRTAVERTQNFSIKEDNASVTYKVDKDDITALLLRIMAHAAERVFIPKYDISILKALEEGLKELQVGILRAKYGYTAKRVLEENPETRTLSKDWNEYTSNYYIYTKPDNFPTTYELALVTDSFIGGMRCSEGQGRERPQTYTSTSLDQKLFNAVGEVCEEMGVHRKLLEMHREKMENNKRRPSAPTTRVAATVPPIPRPGSNTATPVPRPGTNVTQQLVRVAADTQAPPPLPRSETHLEQQRAREAKRVQSQGL